jgi:hypothetical protein
MSLKVVGAGMGRTGTHSQKIALEKLLGEPCYHMVEVFQHPDHVQVWHDAALDKPVDWQSLMAGYAAAVDWPASAFWKEMSEAFPDAIILLSLRDPESWWSSASETIFRHVPSMADDRKEWFAMIQAIFKERFTADIHDKDACIAAFNRNNEEVLREAPKDRLLVWRPQDGWKPICDALGVPVPDEPFPRSNTKEEFIARVIANEPEKLGSKE